MPDRDYIDTKTRRGLRRLLADSDAIIGEVDRLKNLEETKREYPVSSPEFHYLADEIERRSRRVFRIAADERAAGNVTKPRKQITTNEIEP